MSSSKWLWAAAFAALGIALSSVQPAQAEPLTPLTPNELQYLDELRAIFAAKHDPSAFRSDGELLTRGQFVCGKAHAGQIGPQVTYQSPALIQLALIYLCP